MKIRWHRHQWWLTGAVTWQPYLTPKGVGIHTLLTYVCLMDHSHIKQKTLDGNQLRTAEAIYKSQEDKVKAGNIQRTDVPDAFKKAWDEEKG